MSRYRLTSQESFEEYDEGRTSEIQLLNCRSDIRIRELIPSRSVSLLGAFLMGHTLSLRDRHKDNMLVKSNPERYLMIDFEWIMNNDIDLAPPLAIPGEFQEILIELA